MKKTFIIFLSTLLCSAVTFAQKNVKLEFNHMQGSNTFALLKQSTTNTGEDYMANRLEYYVSDIKLEHDGGTITTIDSSWILVDVKGNTSFDLGSFNVTSLEAIHFSIGIDKGVNHNDPAIWPTGHPLAPKSPSMHWGWTAGYRFIAIEGKCGSGLSSIYELHSLGDDYYFKQRIVTAGAVNGSDLIVTLNADYDRFFEDINLGSGIIDHGTFANNIKHLENVRDYVFTSPEGNRNSLTTVGIERSVITDQITVYPNPSNGVVNISSIQGLQASNVKVINAQGQLVQNLVINDSNGPISLEIKEHGLYIISVQKDALEIAREKVLVQ